MALLEGKTPAERNKTIAALVLGAIALVFVLRMFFGSSGTPSNSQANSNRRTTTRTTTRQPADADAAPQELIPPRPVVFRPFAPAISGTGRNIFAFYVPPPPPKKEVVVPTPPPATPTPTPPVTLNAIAPSNVFARTGEFALQVSGDKFTPQTRIYIDGQELPTRYISGQQLSANIPATLITSPGGRQVIIRSPDGLLYSNTATLNVAQPPVPTYTFIGVLVRPRGNDTAILKDQKNELINVQRGDLVGGRFRVTSISDRSIEFTDQQLKIKHTVPFTDARSSGGSSSSPRFGAVPPPPPPKPDEGDEEP
ncbi:MAG TPA: hypothetical protein VF666_17105 [Pyrinomonadaceae bacterium]|jgi:hypothetical protein